MQVRRFLTAVAALGVIGLLAWWILSPPGDGQTRPTPESGQAELPQPRVPAALPPEGTKRIAGMSGHNGGETAAISPDTTKVFVPPLGPATLRPEEWEGMFEIRQEALACYRDFVERAKLTAEEELQVRRILADAQQMFIEYFEQVLPGAGATTMTKAEWTSPFTDLLEEARVEMRKVITLEQFADFMTVCKGLDMFVTAVPFETDSPPEITTKYGWGRMDPSGGAYHELPSRVSMKRK